MAASIESRTCAGCKQTYVVPSLARFCEDRHLDEWYREDSE